MTTKPGIIRRRVNGRTAGVIDGMIDLMAVLEWSMQRPALPIRALEPEQPFLRACQQPYMRHRAKPSLSIVMAGAIWPSITAYG
jgi:hypothetical protein